MIKPKKLRPKPNTWHEISISQNTDIEFVTGHTGRHLYLLMPGTWRYIEYGNGNNWKFYVESVGPKEK